MYLKKHFKIITSLLICFTFLISFNCVQVIAEEDNSADIHKKSLFEAMLKSYDIKSVESKSTVKLNLDISDFDEDTQLMYDMYAPILKNIIFETNTKSNIGESNLVSKSQIDLNAKIGEMEIPLSLWGDVDLSNKQYTYEVVMTIPSIVSMNIPELADKKYLVMDYSKINKILAADTNTDNSENVFNYEKMSELVNKYTPKFIEFGQNYIKQYNPPYKFITPAGFKNITTPDGKTTFTQCYEVNITDSQLKEIIKYTVNNLMENDEGIDLIKDYMIDIMNLANDPETEIAKKEIEQSIDDFKANRAQYSIMVNAFIDTYKDIKILGDKGISFKHYINKEGYIVKTESSYDFVIDLSQFNSITNTTAITEENTIDENKTIDDQYTVNTVDNSLKGIIKLTINSVSENYNINGDVKIEMPETTEENSVDYWDFVLNSMNSNPTIVETEETYINVENTDSISDKTELGN